MAIRQARIVLERAFVGLHRLRFALPVFEQHAEVEEQQGVVAARRERLAIDGLGFGEMSGLVRGCVKTGAKRGQASGYVGWICRIRLLPMSQLRVKESLYATMALIRGCTPRICITRFML